MSEGFFPQTRVSVVEAARSADAGERQRALETLVAAYWRPVYRHVRRKWGKGHEEAADLTQEFFAELLERADVVVEGPEGVGALLRSLARP